MLPVDHETLPSGKGQIRWRNTVQWARHQLVERGLLVPSRRDGEWEISPAGRKALAPEPGS